MNNMNWIKHNKQFINLELVSEIYPYYDNKHAIKFQLDNSTTTISFETEKERDITLNKIRKKIDPLDLDI